MEATPDIDEAEVSAMADGGRALRLVFVCDAYRGRNGTGTYYPDLVAQLQYRVADLALIQPDPDGDTSMASIPLPGDTTQRIAFPGSGEIERAMERVRPHVVVAATPGPYGLAAARAARRHGSALLSGHHTDFLELLALYWGPVRRALALPVLRHLQYRLWRASDAVLVNAGDVSENLRALGARRVEVMGTPLPAEMIRADGDDPPGRLRRVCFIGRLAPEKRVDRVIDAARACPGVQFVVAGDGPSRAQVARAAAELPNLLLRSWLPRIEVCELLDASDLLVLPSESERFGSIALEALCRGRPALVSAAAGIHDWPELRPGLFTLQPEEALGQAITSIRALPPGELARAGREGRRAAWDFHARTVAGWIRTLERYRRLHQHPG